MNAVTATLATHVLIGLVGVIASYGALMALLKSEPSKKTLLWASLVAFFSYLISWFAGGYYYVIHYGSNVKPLVKGGDYPWAHAVFMETKEHVFLFLPVLAFVIFLAVWIGWDRLITSRSMRKSLIAVAAATFLIGLFITLSGIIISGSA